jgi:hypothetical protein
MKKLLSLFLGFIVSTLSLAQAEGSLNSASIKNTSSTLQTEHHLRVTLESRQVLPVSPLVIDTADRDGGNWYTLRAQSEIAQQWLNMSDLLYASGQYTLQNWQLFWSLPIRRDLESWHESRFGENLMYSGNDLDINMPYEGWLEYRGEILNARIGRFDYNEGASKERSLILSGSPWDDAARLNWNFDLLRFHWGALALNPTLMGTPDTPGGTFPEGSEEDLQRTHMYTTAHNRVYDEPQKHFFLHGISIPLKNWKLSLYEAQIIGGKTPTLNEITPLSIWHNAFNSGYANNMVFLELEWQHEVPGRLYAQSALDELSNPFGDEGFPSEIAVLFGWDKKWLTTSSQWQIQMEYIYATPMLGNAQTPLQKVSSRKIYHSNFREQFAPYFADRMLVDYPLGYYRGSDLSDLWIDADWQSNDSLGKIWQAHIQLAWLQQGESNLQELYEEDLARKKLRPLSGTIETRWQAGAELSRTFFQQLSLNLQATYIYQQNAEHLINNNRHLMQLGGGVSYGW